MNASYKLSQKLVAYVLLLGLFLQSCNNFSNPVKPIKQLSTADIQGVSDQFVIKQLVGKEFIAEGGHLVTFHEQDGQLQADVEMNVPERFSKTYTDLDVNIAKDINLEQLPFLSKERQKKLIHVDLPKKGQQRSVYIAETGLKGGMKRNKGKQKIESDEEYEEENGQQVGSVSVVDPEKKNKGKDKDKDKAKDDEADEEQEETEQSDNNDLKNYRELLRLANTENDAEAQFMLGQRAYELWKEDSKKESAYKEALDWLKKAEAQGHEAAIALLQEIHQSSIVLKAKTGNPEAPTEIWHHILSYVIYPEILKFREVQRNWYQFITGYNEVGIVGVNKPKTKCNSSGWISNDEVDFEKLKHPLIAIPSFLFYRLIGRVRNLPKELWPYWKDTHIYTLDLSDNRIEIAGAKKLAECLPKITGLRILNLSNNQIRDAGAKELAECLPKITGLRILNLSSNEISAAGARELAKALPGTQVHILDLRVNQIGDAGAIELAKALPGTQVHTLNLESNHIDTAGAIELAKALPGTQVHTFHLGGNRIDGVGAIELAKVLASTKIHTLHLNSNHIGDVGAIELAKVLPGTQVHTIDLGHNHIGTAGASKLYYARP